MPVAWKTSGSTASLAARPVARAMRSTTALTQGVVTPNIVRPTAGRSIAAGIEWDTIPASAWAALPSTCLDIRLRPATSVTECHMAMSAAPTYGATSPDATVETINLPTPTGRARIAAAMTAVPPDPPSPSTARTSSRDVRKRCSPTAIASSALPRSPVNTAEAPPG